MSARLASTTTSLPSIEDAPRLRMFDLLAWMLAVTACAAPVLSGCQFRWGWSLLVMASGLAWLLWALRPRRNLDTGTPVSWVFGALALLHLAQMIPLPPALLELLAPLKARFLSGSESADSWRALTANMAATRDNLLVLLSCWAAYILGAYTLRRSWPYGTIGMFLFGTVTVLCVYGFWVLAAEPEQTFLGVPSYNNGRLSSVYTNANRFAGLLELTIPLAGSAVVWWMTRHTPPATGLRARLREAWRSTRGAVGILGLAGWLVMWIALMLTQSRMGMAAFVVAGCLAAGKVYRGRIHGGSLLVAGLIGCILLTAGLLLGLEPALQRFSLLGDRQFENFSRLDIWRHAWTLGCDHWLLGGGSGAFRSLFPHYQPSKITGFAKFAHNDYLNLFTDLGLVGLGLVLTGMYQWWRHVMQASTELLGVRRLALFAICWSVVSLSLHALADFNHQEPANAWIFCWLLGAGVGLVRYSRDGLSSDELPAVKEDAAEPKDRRRWYALPAAFMLLAGGGVLWSEHAWPDQDPTRTQLWHHHARQDLDTALGKTGTACTFDPFTATPLLAEARARLDRAAGAKPGSDMRTAQLHAAEAAADAALVREPLNPRGWYVKARVALTRDGDLPRAKALTQQALKAAPSMPGVAFQHARIALYTWRAEGRPGYAVPDEILEAFARAAEEDRHDLGYALAELVTTTPWEKRWAGIVPEHPASWRLYGRFLASRKLYPEAREALTRAYDLAQSHPMARATDRERLIHEIDHDRALVELLTGHPQEGLERLIAALDRVPPYQRPGRAEKYWAEVRNYGAPDGGVSFCQAVADTWPDEAWAWILVGRAATLEGLDARAEAAYAKALRLRPSGDIHAQLAALHFGRGRIDSALVSMEKAVAALPANASYRLSLAELLSRRGYYQRAVQELNAAKQLDPGMNSRIERMREKFARRRAALTDER